MPGSRCFISIVVALAGASALAQGPVDRLGDPVQDGAVLRLGTSRWRHPGATRVVFSSDGKWLLTAGEDNSRVFDAATGRLRVELPCGQNAAISPDARLVIASGRHLRGNYDTTYMFDGVTGKWRYELPQARGPFAFSPDG